MKKVFVNKITTLFYVNLQFYFYYINIKKFNIFGIIKYVLMMKKRV